MFGQTILVSPKLVVNCTTVVVLSVSISYQGCTILLQSVHPLMPRQDYDRETGYGVYGLWRGGKLHSCYDKSGAPCHYHQKGKKKKIEIE